MDYKKLELRLRQIVEKRLEEGYPLKTGAEFGTICLLEAIGIELGVDGYFVSARVVADEFGDDISDSLELGFEQFHNERPAPDLEAYDIGARIRRDYCEWE